MNRLAGIVAGTALAGGEDKWYEDSAGLLSYNVLKPGRAANARRPPTCIAPRWTSACRPRSSRSCGDYMHDVLSGAITDICPQYINLVYPTGTVS